MRLQRIPSQALCIAAITALFMVGTDAQARTVWNKKTTFTFSGPVEIPGVHQRDFGVLPAGTYVFKLMDSQSNRHIVQIQDADEGYTYATIFTIPDVRARPTSETVLTFRERPAGEPAAIHSWFYPGETWGDEFVYPKARVKQMAMASTTTQTARSERSEEVSTRVDEPIQRAPEPVVAENTVTTDEVTVAPAPEPAPLIAQDTQPATMPTTTRAPEPVSAPAELPHTAGEVGLLMLGGLFALGGAVALRSFLARSV